MDFAVPDEHRMILEYGDRIVQKYDRKHWMEKANKQEFPLDMWKQIGEDGFIGIMVPEEYGGAGLGMTEMSYLMEGMANNGIPLFMLIISSTMAMGYIAKYGSEAQKRKYLPTACLGESNFCFAITESNAGTNSLKIETLAKEVFGSDGSNEGKFLLKGSKTFITGADVADYAIVVSRTKRYQDVEQKTDGFTLFIVDLNAEGVERQKIEVSIAAPDSQYQIFFDDVEVTVDDVIGEVHNGFSILFDTLNPERIMVAAMCVGIGRFALNEAVKYANERQVFDCPIGAYQGVQHPLAAAKTEIEMAALMTRKAAWAFDQKLPAGEFANMAKYYAAEASINAVEAAIQTFGGNAFTKDYGIYDLYPLVRLMRTAPLNREMILNYIGEKVMGLPRAY